VLCDLGLCIGYSLGGAAWLVRKCEDDVQHHGYRLVPYLALALLVFLLVVFGYALTEKLEVMGRWLQRPYLLVFPACSVFAGIGLAASVVRHRDAASFTMDAIIFAAALGTLAISFWPYMVRFSITSEEATAPYRLHVLGQGPVPVSADASLYHDQLPRVPRQGQTHGWTLLGSIKGRP
jgi:cytochrome d ubiquinol oxidase subunit II